MSESQFETLHELVKKARQNLNLNNWDYLVGGTETETTLKRNRLALDTIALRPRVLCDVSQVDTSTTFLGRKLRMPLLLAPVGSLELFEAGGGATAARASQQMGVITMLSSVCLPGIEEVAKAAPDATRIFQLYVHGDPKWVSDIADRVMASGYHAFCLTVDTAWYSRRERDLAKRNFRRRVVLGRENQPKLNWKDIDRIKKQLKIPLILKGIGTAEDAKLCLEHGVDVVYVSNHGGRQLDHGLGAMDVLPGIVDAVAGKAKVIVDGGFNRGTDVIKAIAAGADIVGLGRMEAIAMAAAGEPGLVRMLELMEIEMQTSMGLMGVAKLAELNRTYLTPAQSVTPPSVLSAFPHLNLGDGTFY